VDVQLGILPAVSHIRQLRYLLGSSPDVGKWLGALTLSALAGTSSYISGIYRGPLTRDNSVPFRFGEILAWQENQVKKETFVAGPYEDRHTAYVYTV